MPTTHKIALIAPVDGLTPLSLVASDVNRKLDSVTLGAGLDYGSGGILSLIPSEIDHDSLLNVHQDVNTDASPVFAGATIGSVAIPGMFTAMTEPTGFVDRVATISWNDATYTLTITGNHDIYINGVKTTKTTASIQITDATGLYYIYYNAAGTLTSSTVHPGFALPLMATVYWNTTTDKGLVGEERHGIKMDMDTHTLLHYTVGTRYESGLAGTFADTTFSIAAGVIDDEDITLSITPAKTTCNVLYKDGAAEFKWLAGQTKYYYEDGGSDLNYNNGNTLTPLAANKYMAVWIFATNDTTTPIVSLIGQRTDTTITDARNNNKYESLTLGTLPFQEMKLLYRVILQNTATPYVETQDLRNISNLPAGTYVATAHNVLTGLTSDDHSQYALLAGRSGGQTLTGSDTTAEDLTLKDNSVNNNTITVTQAIAAYTHKSNNGTDHSYINQSVTTGASPQFAKVGIGEDPTSLLEVTGTLSSAVNAVDMTFATSGSDATARRGVWAQLSAGFTGAANTDVLTFLNYAAGTANVYTGDQSYGWRPEGNRGAGGYALGTGTINVGAMALAGNASSMNWGMMGGACIDKDSANNVGVFGTAQNSGTSGIQVGGYFTLFDTNASVPTFVSAALIADNAAQTSPIFLARDNGTTVFTIADGGNVTIGSLAGILKGTAGVVSGGATHAELASIDSNQHIDHTTVSISAGTGMSGGGTIAADRTLNCTITQYTDEMAQDAIGSILDDSSSIDFSYGDSTGYISAVVLPAGVDHDSLLNFVANEHIDHSGVSISPGTGMSGGGDLTTTRTLNCTITQYTDALARTACIAASISDGDTTHSPDGNSVFDALALKAPLASPTFTDTVTLSASTLIPDGGTIGQAAGPLIAFDDTLNYLEITGCNVGIGTITPAELLHIQAATAAGLRLSHTTTSSYSLFSFYESTTARASITLIGSALTTTSRRNDLEIVTNTGDIMLYPQVNIGITHRANYITPAAMVHIDQDSTTAAIPVLTLDQGDISEEFIRFIGTAADNVITQSIVAAADVGVATIAGYVKVYVQDDGNQITDQAYYMPIYTLAAP